MATSKNDALGENSFSQKKSKKNHYSRSSKSFTFYGNSTVIYVETNYKYICHQEWGTFIWEPILGLNPQIVLIFLSMSRGCEFFFISDSKQKILLPKHYTMQYKSIFQSNYKDMVSVKQRQS